jgi:hypothetical protein
MIWPSTSAESLILSLIKSVSSMRQRLKMYCAIFYVKKFNSVKKSPLWFCLFGSQHKYVTVDFSIF